MPACWQCGAINPGGYTFCWNDRVPAAQPPALAASRSLVVVDLAGIATLAAAQAAVNAAVAQAIAQGFMPERVEPAGSSRAGAPASSFGLVVTGAAKRDWSGMTSALCKLVPLPGPGGGGQPAGALPGTSLGSQAAFVAAAAQAGGATPSLRGGVEISPVIGGVPTDLLVMLFTDGAPAGGGVVVTGTGVLTAIGGVLQGAASLIVDANVDPAAGIAGSKIAPDFGVGAMIHGRGIQFEELVENGAGPFNDYAIGNYSQLYVAAAGAAVTFTGFAAPGTGKPQELIIISPPTGFGVILTDESAASVAVNRIRNGIASAQPNWHLRWSPAMNRWRVCGYPV